MNVLVLKPMSEIRILDPRGGHNRYNCNFNFFKKWSVEMAYVLGFLYADGAIEDSRISSRTQYITFASKDKDLLGTIKRTLKSEHPIHYRPPHKVLYGNGKTYESAESYHLRIGSKRMYADLLEVGLLPNKSKIIRFPSDIPNKYLGHFVRGYFDGDGCVHIKKGRGKKRDIILKGLNVIFTSGSKLFLEGLSAGINKFVKPNQNKIYNGHRAYQLRYSTSDSIKWFKFLYKNTPKGLYLKRKLEIFIKYFQLRPLKVDKEIIKILDNLKAWRGTQEAREWSAKPFYASAILAHASGFAGVVESQYTRDLKSLGGNSVRVGVPPPALLKKPRAERGAFLVPN